MPILARHRAAGVADQNAEKAAIREQIVALREEICTLKNELSDWEDSASRMVTCTDVDGMERTANMTKAEVIALVARLEAKITELEDKLESPSV